MLLEFRSFSGNLCKHFGDCSCMLRLHKLIFNVLSGPGCLPTYALREGRKKKRKKAAASNLVFTFLFSV